MSKERNKNWVLFPEKLDGKFAIIHGMLDKVMVEYVTSLDMCAPHKKHAKSRRHARIQGRKQKKLLGLLDARSRNAAPKDDKGWLLFYNVVSHLDPGKYKVGAMLLDLKDPSIIIIQIAATDPRAEMPYEMMASRASYMLRARS